MITSTALINCFNVLRVKLIGKVNEVRRNKATSLTQTTKPSFVVFLKLILKTLSPEFLVPFVAITFLLHVFSEMIYLASQQCTLK